MRNNRKRMIKRIAALTASLVLAVPQAALAQPEAALPEEEQVFYIENTEQFLEMSARCSSEAYTLGKTWVLETDIYLAGEDYSPMGIFSGTFEGNGHRIQGLQVTEAGSNQGLFRFVGEQATVRNLHVEGMVAPSGSGDNVGGIAGTNRGLIENCSFSGNVEGKLKTGGIAGYNEGTIRGCTNNGAVNTSGEEGTGENEDGMSMDSISIRDAVRTEKINDAGGIAGFSEGIIEDCVNRGEVGCAQTGYNLGGIAGRQSGIVRRCENRGPIQGRKDVGGIVGQMEPYLTLRYEEDTFQSLNRQMDALSDLARAMTDTVDSTTDRAEADIDRIGDGLELWKNEARSQRDYYREQAEQWREDLDDCLDDLSDILEEIDLEPSSSFSKDVSDLKKNVKKAKELLKELRENPLQPEVFEQLRTCVDEIFSGMLYLGASGPEVLRDSIRDISDDMDNIRWRMDDIIDLTRDQLNQLSDDLDGTEQAMGARTDQVSDDIDVLKDGIKEGKSQLRGQKNQLKDQIRAMEDTISDGLDRIQEDKDLVVDLSEEMDDVTPSAVIQCRNSGSVEAAFQAGGIVGTLGMELEGEPELDMETVGDKSLNMIRELRATVAHCRNVADIFTKGDHVGGIVGKAGAGALVGNENYGDIRADEGTLAGGIAGSSSGKLNGNYTFCHIYGGDYTGGIVGQGTDLYRNYAMVTLEGEPGSEWRGAIAGDVDSEGEVRENVYLENGLGAVDGITYMEEASGLSYEELLMMEHIPDEFKSMKVSFLADGKLVKVLECPYGGQIVEHQIPLVPEKDGFEGSWQKIDLSHVTRNLRVEAVYRSWLTTIASSEGKTPLLLAEGKFHPADVPTIKELTAEDISKLSLPDGYEAQRAYAYQLPEEAVESYRLHLYNGDGPKKAFVGEVMADGSIRIAETDKDGDYLVFMAGNGGTLVVMTRSYHFLWLLIAMGGICAGLLILTRYRRRKAKTVPDASSPA